MSKLSPNRKPQKHESKLVDHILLSHGKNYVEKCLRNGSKLGGICSKDRNRYYQEKKKLASSLASLYMLLEEKRCECIAAFSDRQEDLRTCITLYAHSELISLPVACQLCKDMLTFKRFHRKVEGGTNCAQAVSALCSSFDKAKDTSGVACRSVEEQICKPFETLVARETNVTKIRMSAAEFEMRAAKKVEDRCMKLKFCPK